MGSVLKQITVVASPDAVWEAVCDFGSAHRRMAPGVLADCHMEGDERVVTFANGLVLYERLLDIDHAERRLSYTARGGAASYHHASFRVTPDGDGTLLSWRVDLLPHEIAPQVAGLMDQVMAAIQAHFDTVEGGQA
jgi:carbon monoxide dehydrogenase subunit G